MVLTYSLYKCTLYIDASPLTGHNQSKNKQKFVSKMFSKFTSLRMRWELHSKTVGNYKLYPEDAIAKF